MRRIVGLLLGWLGLIVPGFLVHLQIPKLFCPVGEVESIILIQGFFYTFAQIKWWGGITVTGSQGLNSQWLSPKYWGGSVALFLFLVSFGLITLSLIVSLISPRKGSYLMLLAGITSFGFMMIVYTNIV